MKFPVDFHIITCPLMFLSNPDNTFALVVKDM